MNAFVDLKNVGDTSKLGLRVSLTELGFKWENGKTPMDWFPKVFSIGYSTEDGYLSGNWLPDEGVQVRIPTFLQALRMEKSINELKKRKAELEKELEE